MDQLQAQLQGDGPASGGSSDVSRICGLLTLLRQQFMDKSPGKRPADTPRLWSSIIMALRQTQTPEARERGRKRGQRLGGGERGERRRRSGLQALTAAQLRPLAAGWPPAAAAAFARGRTRATAMSTTTPHVCTHMYGHTGRLGRSTAGCMWHARLCLGQWRHGTDAPALRPAARRTHDSLYACRCTSPPARPWRRWARPAQPAPSWSARCGAGGSPTVWPGRSARSALQRSRPETNPDRNRLPPLPAACVH